MEVFEHHSQADDELPECLRPFLLKSLLRIPHKGWYADVFLNGLGSGRAVSCSMSIKSRHGMDGHELMGVILGVSGKKTVWLSIQRSSLSSSRVSKSYENSSAVKSFICLAVDS